MSEVKFETIKYYCCSDERRNLVQSHPSLNGIDFIEVSEDQKTMTVQFLKSLKDTFTDNSGNADKSHYEQLNKSNFLIKGGEKIINVNVSKVIRGPESNPPLTENIILLELPNGGDFSRYTLHIVKDIGDISYERVQGMDLLLSKIEFSFKVNCPDDFDCKGEDLCYEQGTENAPFINYLAKDYSSFRQLIFDRFSQTLPEWKERNPSDIGVTLIELLAYTADYLSYRQDAVSSEAYLGTCRKRISATRHARLTDYRVSNGCNSRTWVYVPLDDSSAIEIKKDDNIKFLTKVSGLPPAIISGSNEANMAINANPTIFELMHDVVLDSRHNEMMFYTFGEKNCCLPKGATSATLKGNFNTLNKNDFIFLMEVKGPNTGVKEDADINKRHVVRLNKIEVFQDFDFDNLEFNPTVEVTKISWHTEDALPFSLCISSDNGEKIFSDVSVVLGNIALCDNGLTFEDKDFENSSIFPSKVPPSIGSFSSSNATSMCGDIKPNMVPIRYRPILKGHPLTFAEDILEKNDSDKSKINTSFSANRVLNQEASNALPSMQLNDIDNYMWEPRFDLLLDSSSLSKHFVVEVESDSTVNLRFGDDINGARPNADNIFKATFRLGNGTAGNIGADTIYHIIAPQAVASNLISLASNGRQITNPLPGRGGRNPETLEEIKQNAPVAFRGRQERAITSEDYAFLSQRDNTNVQKAAAHFRWTGSWNTAFVAIDFKGDKAEKDTEKNKLLNLLNKYRLAGLDLVIDDPIFVSLIIEMQLCISKDSYQSEVLALLENRFSNRIQSSGKFGFFHADNFSFGDTLYLSNIYKVAQNVPGVTSVEILKFHKINEEQNNQININAGKIEFGKREIARLDNNPNFRDRGTIKFIIKGGK